MTFDANANIVVDAFATLFLGCIFFGSLFDRNTNHLPRDRWFNIIAFIMCVRFVSDAISWGVDGNPTNIGFSYFITWLNFASGYILVAAFNHYIKSCLVKPSKALSYLVYILDAIGLAFCLLAFVSIFTGWFFYYDDMGVYHRGGFGFYVSYSYSALAVIVSIILIFFKKEFDIREKLALVLYCLAPIIGIILQLVYYGVPSTTIASVISMLIVYMNIQATRAAKQIVDIKVANATNENKNEFLTRMSHDLRTPLNGIIGMTNAAKANIDDKEGVELCLEKIDLSSQHLLALINDVLDMSLIESGKVKVQAKTVDLIKVIEECIEMAEIQSSERELTFKFVNEIAKDYYVVSDDLVLKRIILNVLSNACKFTDNQGIITLKLSLVRHDGFRSFVRLSIEDTGIGMSPEFLESVFKPFEQEHPGARSEFNGTGLGLPITKALVEKLNGSIMATSEVGVGTKVSMDIPFERIAFSSNDKIKNSTIDMVDLSGTKVLIVEDNEMNMEIVKMMMDENGITYDCAENGLIGYNKFKASKKGEYLAILMDVMMPVMDGITATMEIRRLERDDAQKIAIVGTSANAYQTDVDKGLVAGMNYYLTKPLNPDEVIKTLSIIYKTDYEPQGE